MKERFLFTKSHKLIIENYKPKYIIKDYARLVEIRISILEEFLNTYIAEPEVEYLVSKSFKPSRTAQNGLNFITKEEEENLRNMEYNDEIANIVRIIYILMKQNYDKVNPEMLVENLFSNIFQKFKIENLSIYLI